MATAAFALGGFEFGQLRKRLVLLALVAERLENSDRFHGPALSFVEIAALSCQQAELAIT
jgi:hypothetical protein